jgi:hypothetical protein
MAVANEFPGFSKVLNAFPSGLRGIENIDFHAENFGVNLVRIDWK